jgi:hypothetical protein
MSVMLDQSIDRASTLRALETLLKSAQANDTIFLSVAGHGAQEPERVKGSQPDGMDAVFLMPGFDPRDQKRSSEKILHSEFNHYIKAFEEKGARVFFVADACSGGGLAREVDPRAATMIYRSVSYSPIGDKLEPVSSRADALLSPIDFQRSIFLAAVDKQSKVPEIKIEGAGYRGALSYAIARALEGAADKKGDGRITTEEIFDYVRQFVYQLSDERQTIVAASPSDVDPRKDVIVELNRGVSVQAVSGGGASSGGGLIITPVEPASIGPGAVTGLPMAPPAQVERPKETIKVAFRGAKADRTDISPQSPFELVSVDANPDVIYDAAAQEAIAGGDVLAHNVDRKDLAGVIDRTAAVKWLKMRAGKGPQPIRVLPNDGLHRKGEQIEVSIGGVSGRNLVLFNIAGDGTVQFLYPVGADRPVIKDPEYRLSLQAREPLGADQLVAITSSVDMSQLQRMLRGLDRVRNPLRAADLVNQYARGDATLGSVGVYTAP